jgi:hypothetical protein
MNCWTKNLARSTADTLADRPKPRRTGDQSGAIINRQAQVARRTKYRQRKHRQKFTPAAEGRRNENSTSDYQIHPKINSTHGKQETIFLLKYDCNQFMVITTISPLFDLLELKIIHDTLTLD